MESHYTCKWEGCENPVNSGVGKGSYCDVPQGDGPSHRSMKAAQRIAEGKSRVKPQSKLKPQKEDKTSEDFRRRALAIFQEALQEIAVADNEFKVAKRKWNGTLDDLKLEE